MSEISEAPKRRLRACVEAWPECETGEYNPACCRFPKSCSATIYDPTRVDDSDLEPNAEIEEQGPMSEVSSEAVEHYPASVGSVMSEGYTGPYIVCACQADEWGNGPRIPAREYPAHLAAHQPAPSVEDREAREQSDWQVRSLRQYIVRLREQVERKDLALAEATDLLAAHQPARVVPSAEEVAAVQHAHRADLWGSLDDPITDEHGTVVMSRCICGERLDNDGDHDGWPAMDHHVAHAVLALFASQPTVAQVREQVARDLLAAKRRNSGNDDPEVRRLLTYEYAVRIARTETKGGE